MKIGKNRKLFEVVLTGFLCAGIALPASVSARTDASATATLPFVDIEAVSPYIGSITNLYHLNIMEGTSEHTFSPDAPLTRGQFAKLIATAFKPRAYEGPELFADVAGHWSKPYVMQAYGAGYVEGTGASAFEPDLPLSGQAAGTIIWRILGGMGIAAPISAVSAPSVEADDWAAASIDQLQKLGVWPSSADTKPLPPKQTMTRAQAAVLLDFSIQLLNRIDSNKDSSSDRSRAASSTDGSNSNSTGGGNNGSNASVKPRETGDNRVEAISISSPGEYKSTLSKAWFKLHWPEKRQLLLQSPDAERLMLTDRDGKRIELPADKPLVFTAEANTVYYVNGIGSLSVFDGRSVKHAYPLGTIAEAALLPPIELPPDQTVFFGLTLEAVKHYQFELTGSASSNYNSAVKMLDAASKELKKISGSRLDLQIRESGKYYFAVTPSTSSSPEFSFTVIELGHGIQTPIHLHAGQSYTAPFNKDGTLVVSFDGFTRRPVYMIADNAQSINEYRHYPVIYRQNIGVLLPKGTDPTYTTILAPETISYPNDRANLFCTSCITTVVSNGQPITTIRLMNGLSFDSAYELDAEARSELPYKLSALGQRPAFAPKPEVEPGDMYIKTTLKKELAYELQAVDRKGLTSSANIEYQAPKFDIYDSDKKLLKQGLASRSSFVPPEDGVYYIHMVPGSNVNGYDIFVRKPE